jgi:oxygen-independent coproporphyrinogen III oxidase
MPGLYIHIPFCKQACYYCDFHFTTKQDNRKEIIEAIGKEIALQKEYLAGDSIRTIYFGGGTPSLLSEHELNFILQSVYNSFSVADSPEITLEANPDDLTKTKLKQLRHSGINRLSIGVQSFDDSILRSLNRAHDSAMAKSAVHDAYEAGFTNISLDLIYAIPGLDNDLWEKNIYEMLMHTPQHISSYSLTIEEKTVFGRWAARGKIKSVEDDEAGAQLLILADILEKENYEQYEVSNFSLPGFHSRHNSSYWKDNGYLGVGPSAHSYNGVSRQYNVSNNYHYLRSLSENKIPATLEILTVEDRINEYLLTTLRTSWGVDLGKLRCEFGFDLIEKYGPYVQSLQENKLATISNDTLLLTKQGKLLADKIASDLFVIAS